MSAHLACVIGLCLVFIVGTALPVNMGAVAFVAAFIVGTYVLGMSATTILAGFPGDLFVTLVGITYLFAIAQNNGTVDWLVRQAMRLVRGHVAAIPWVIFFVTALLTGLGAVSPGAVAIIAPVALRFSKQYGISPLLMGLMAIHGAQGGGFSPMSIYGGITNQVVQRAALPGDEIYLFLASFIFNLLVAVAIFFVFGGRGLLARRLGPSDTAERAVERAMLTRQQVITLAGLGALGIGVLGLELNVGLVAITVAVVLTMLFPKDQKGAVEQVHWPTILLICGVVTYVSVLQKAGTIDFVGTSVANGSTPVLGALLLCYVGALVSAFASTVGVLGAIIPLAVPMLALGHIDAVSVVSALAISSSIVDVSPFSTNGALVLASAQGADREALSRQLLLYTCVVVVLGPLLAWACLVLPSL